MGIVDSLESAGGEEWASLVSDHVEERQKEVREAAWPSRRWSRQEICLDSKVESLFDLGQVLCPM